MAKKQRAAATANPAATSNPILSSLPEPSLVQVDPSRLQLNPDNPARARGEDLSDMIDSVRQHGILQPPVVRSMGGDNPNVIDCDTLQVIAGERRVRAAAALKLPLIPVLAYPFGAVDDRRALEVALVENLQRSDMSPIDEARAFGVLRDSGLTLEDIRAHVGRSLAHVHRRLLLLDLNPVVGQMFNLGWLTVGAIEEFARLTGHAQQLAAAVEALQENGGGYGKGFDLACAGKGAFLPENAPDFPITAAIARSIMERVSRELAGAPWDLGDAQLVPEAGSCTACPKRSQAQASMFAGALPGGRGQDGDLCMDETCWAKKVKAHAGVVVARAKADGAKVLSAAESKRLYGQRTYLVSSEVTELDSPCGLPGKRGTWRAVLRDVLPQLEVMVATDGDGVPHALVDKQALNRVVKKAGIVKTPAKPARTADDARRANERAARARMRELADAVLDEVLVHVGDANSGVIPQAAWELVVRRLLGGASYDGLKDLARRISRNGVPVSAADVQEHVLASALTYPRRAFELAALDDDWTWVDFGGEHPSFAKKAHVGLPESVALAAHAWGVDVGKIAKRLEREREKAAAPAAKGKAGAKAKPAAAGAKKAKAKRAKGRGRGASAGKGA